MDEVYAILMCVPFVGWAIAWVRSRIAMWRGRHNPPCCVHDDRVIHGHLGDIYEPLDTHCLVGPDVTLCEFAAGASVEKDRRVGSYRDEDVTCTTCLDHMA